MSTQHDTTTGRAGEACRMRTTSAFMRMVVRQFGHPRGPLGAVAGWIMAGRASNRIRNSWTIALLDLAPGDRVLELGSGPGLALAEIAPLLTAGKVVGVDHSATMVRQARRRNREALRDGRLEIHRASADAAPGLGAPFDKILAINAYQFFDDQVATLERLRESLRPGGRIAITFQPRWRGATDADAMQAGARILADLQAAGFGETRLEINQLRPAAVCALGVRVAGEPDDTRGPTPGPRPNQGVRDE
jgi:SAM-dependent methyltransferase